MDRQLAKIPVQLPEIDKAQDVHVPYIGVNVIYTY
jgi:hypothetical protein